MKLPACSPGRPAKNILTIVALLLLAPLVFLGVWLVDLDREISDKISSEHWGIPAKIYSRPMEIYVGKRTTADNVISELNLLGYVHAELNTDPHTAGYYSAKPNSNETILEIHTRSFTFSDGTEPSVTANIRFANGVIEELDQPGFAGRMLRLEPLLLGTIHPAQHEDREIVGIKDLPPEFLNTLITIEDRKFRSHWGISVKGILRAAWVNSRTGKRSQGASTLTQQLIKNIFLSSEKTYRRKFKEAFMALLLELRYSKDQILEMFINEVFLAQDGNRAIHGFGLASRHFFARPLSELTVAEYSLLIGMIKAPSAYNPVRNPQRATQRRNLVLDIMHQRGAISSFEVQQYKSQPLGVTTNNSGSVGNPAYLDLVRRQLLTDYSLDDLQVGGLKVFTNYDPILQRSVDTAVASFLTNFDQRYPQLGPDFLQPAVLLSDPNTGDIKAIRGGRQTRLSSFNRAIDAQRPVGSLLKPAIYLSAWEQPQKYAPGSLIEDAPVSLVLANGTVWEPQNYDKTTHGKVMMIDALSDSLNLSAAKLGLELGVSQVVDTLRRLGVDKDLPEVPALLLGATELTPFDVLRLYQGIASDGYKMPLRTINEVVNSKGETLSQYNVEISNEFDISTMYLLKYALADTMRRGTGRAAYQHLDKEFYVAGKTGTTDDLRDSWFAGYSGDYLAVVWLGNDENLPTPLTGSSGALKIWTALFDDIAKESLSFAVPDKISYVTIDPKSGHITRDNCRGSERLPFITGFQPAERISCRGRGSKINNWIKSLLD